MRLRYGDVQHTPLETANAAADRVPAGVPSLPPRMGSEELAEGRSSEKLKLMSSTQPRAAGGSGAPGLAGLRGSLGKRKGASKHSSVGQRKVG